MTQIEQFSYDSFWEEREPSPPQPAIELDGWVDEIELEVPAPPWVRLVSRRDPFPPCVALRPWPQNYPVCELADLTEDELDEDDVGGFVYSDAELEAWAQIVGGLLDEATGLALDGSSFARIRKEAPSRGLHEVKTMDKTNQSNQREPASEGEGRAPPVWKTSAGGVRLAVWRNPAPKGGDFYTVTLERRYKRGDGEWASSANLRLNDIPKAILALQVAYERMLLAPETLGEEEEGGEAPFSVSHPTRAPAPHAPQDLRSAPESS